MATTTRTERKAARAARSAKRNISESQTIVTETPAVFPELKAPVSIIIPPAEVKKEEPVVETASSSEDFLEDFPKAEVEAETSTVAILKNGAPEEKKTEPIKNNIEYPPSSMPVIAKLRKNPAYSRLTDAALLRIASSKIRSKYFFK